MENVKIAKNTRKKILGLLAFMCLLSSFSGAKGMMFGTINFVAPAILKKYRMHGCKNEIERIYRLVKYGYTEDITKESVNKADSHGTTPLYLACENNDLSMVRSLLGLSADPNIANVNGFTPLHIISNPDIALELIDAGANVNAVITDERYKGKTPFYFACRDGNTQVAKLFLKKGANVNDVDANAVDTFGEPLLSLALHDNNLEMIRLLLELGANPNIADGYGYMPLCVACANNKLSMVRLLLEYGANPNIVSKNGTPLDCAYNGIYDPELEIVRLLLEYGANIDQTLLETVQKNIQEQEKNSIDVQILDLLNLMQRFDKYYSLTHDERIWLEDEQGKLPTGELLEFAKRLKNSKRAGKQSIYTCKDAPKIGLTNIEERKLYNLRIINK